MDLKGKVALVTGASRGIGAATARLLAATGAVVGVNYVTRPELAEQAVKAIHAAGGRAMAVEADVSDKAQVHQRCFCAIGGASRPALRPAVRPAHGAKTFD